MENLKINFISRIRKINLMAMFLKIKHKTTAAKTLVQRPSKSPFLLVGDCVWVHDLQEGGLRPQKSVWGRDSARKSPRQWWLVGVGRQTGRQLS